MKVRDVMTRQVIRIGAEEPVEVAARALTHYNIGVLPVADRDGHICGVVTDRDLVTRCMAAERPADNTKVRDVMTGRVVFAGPDMEVGVASQLMGREQVRRLPVMENGRLCGMVSLADLARAGDYAIDAADALAEISANISVKKY